MILFFYRLYRKISSALWFWSMKTRYWFRDTFESRRHREMHLALKQAMEDDMERREWDFPEIDENAAQASLDEAIRKHEEFE